MANTNGRAPASVLVTGASRGIGLAIANRFADAGARVTICARDVAVVAREHPRLACIACDMSDKAQVQALGARVLASGGPPEVLVNNAGAYLPGSLHEEADGTFEAMIAVNLASAYHLTRALLPAMIARGSGTILNVCSTASVTPYVNGGSYGIAKHALYGFNKTLREELKPHGIRVIALLPGATLTSSWAGTDLPEERFMPAGDIAELAWTAWSLSERTVVEELRVRPMLGDLP